MAADGEKSNKKISDDIFVEPNYDPDAVLRYYQSSSGIGSKPNYDTKSLIDNAKKHLSAIGWSFFKILKGPNNNKELRYRSPSGKTYISLRTACKAFLTITDSLQLNPPGKKDIVDFGDGFLKQSQFPSVNPCYRGHDSASVPEKLSPEINGSVPHELPQESELPPEINGAVPQEIIPKKQGRKRSRDSPDFPRKRARFIVGCHCDLHKFVSKVAIYNCCCGRDPNFLDHNLMTLGGIVACHVLWQARWVPDDEVNKFLALFVSQSIFTATLFLVLRLLNQYKFLQVFPSRISERNS